MLMLILMIVDMETGLWMKDSRLPLPSYGITLGM